MQEVRSAIGVFNQGTSVQVNIAAGEVPACTFHHRIYLPRRVIHVFRHVTARRFLHTKAIRIIKISCSRSVIYLNNTVFSVIAVVVIRVMRHVSGRVVSVRRA